MIITVFTAGLASSPKKTRSLTAAAPAKAKVAAKSRMTLKAKAPALRRRPASPTSSVTQASSPPRLSAAEERSLQLLKKKKQTSQWKAEEARKQGVFFSSLCIYSLMSHYAAIHDCALALVAAEADTDDEGAVSPEEGDNGNNDSDAAAFEEMFGSE